MKWHYEELTDVINKLQFSASGFGVFDVGFDVNSNPVVCPLVGSPFFTEVPKEDVPELLAMIKKRYPNGFHSRVDPGFEWLKSRIEELALRASIEIKSFIPYGCLMVDGKNYDAYRLEINHEKITSPIYIVMTSYCEGFVVFRPYIQIEEFGTPNNVAAFEFETELTLSSRDDTFYSNGEILSFKKYTYSFNDKKLCFVHHGFKNNTIGFMNESKFGKFMAAGGVSYLS